MSCLCLSLVSVDDSVFYIQSVDDSVFSVYSVDDSVLSLHSVDDSVFSVHFRSLFQPSPFSSRTPTQNKRYTFMHNGGIPGFSKMKRQLLSLLGDEAYQAIEGTTDSEVRGGRCIRAKKKENNISCFETPNIVEHPTFPPAPTSLVIKLTQCYMPTR